MKTIWKFDLAEMDGTDAYFREQVLMPEGAKVIHVGMQGSRLMLWAIVDPKAEKEFRSFRVFGTGHPLDQERFGSYVGTVMNDPYVWHIFE